LAIANLLQFFKEEEVKMPLIEDNNSYALIICDEGQDFTRIETDILTQFLVYRHFDMRGHGTSRLPLLVAADPFQTINPSGFRWEGVKDILATSLQNNNVSIRDISVHHAELEYNYRNTWHIACLANTVQAARQFLLKRNVKAQKIWRIGKEDHPIGRVEINKETVGHIMHTIQSADVEVIVPHKEAEIPLLALLTEMTEQDFLVTPDEIKGLERETIVVAGFGDYFVEKFGSKEQFRNGNWLLPEDTSSQSDFYQLEYFINNLYVAVTRAREELILIDSEKGFHDFWDFLREKVFNWIGDASEGTGFVWESDCNYEKVEYDLNALKGADPVDQARDWREKGAKSQDAQDMERAAYWYGRALKKIGTDPRLRPYNRDELLREKKECEALALRFTGRYREAALKMRDEAHEPQKAAEWLWQSGELWDDLKDTIGRHKNDLPPVWSNRRELCELPSFSTRVNTADEIRRQANRFLEMLEEEERSRGMARGAGPDREPWGKLLSAFLALVENNLTLLSMDTIRNSYLFVKPMEAFYPLSYSELAALAYHCSLHDDAIRYFELSGRKNDVRYHELMAQRKQYPENLLHWESAGYSEEVLKEFRQNMGASTFDEAWLQLEPPDRRRIVRSMAKDDSISRENCVRILAYNLFLSEPENARKFFNEMENKQLIYKEFPRHLKKSLLDLAILDPRPTSDQLQPERRATDYFWTFASSLLANDSFESTESEFALELLSHSPSGSRLWEKIREDRKRVAPVKKIVPLLLSKINEVAPSHQEKSEKEASARLSLRLGWYFAPVKKEGSGKKEELEADVRRAFQYMEIQKRVDVLLNSLSAATKSLAGLKEESYDRDTQRMVEAVAELFGDIRNIRQYSTNKNWENDTLVKAVETNWRIIGKFQESSPFRLHAIRFYESILETISDEEEKVSAQNALDRSRKRKETYDQKEEVLLHPGRQCNEGRITVRFFGNGKNVAIEDADEGARVNFSIEKMRINLDDEFVSKEEATGQTTEGKLSFKDIWSITYRWEKEAGRLRISLPSGKEIWLNR